MKTLPPKDWVVSNTGPLITLEKLPDGFSFARRLYQKIAIPPKVLEELIQGIAMSSDAYLELYGIKDFLDIRAVEINPHIVGLRSLEEGEVYALSLAVKLGKPLLVEDKEAKQIAQNHGIQVSGIAGQIIKAYKNGIIERAEAEVKLYQLRFVAFRINAKVYQRLMQDLNTIK